MLIEFFLCLRRHGLQTSITELLDLLKALEQQVVFADVEAFYYLARLTLVKDESQFDRFDRAFAEYFEGVEQVDLASAIPEDWLRRSLQRQLSDEDKAKLQSMGGLDELLNAFQERLKEQQKRHAGGNKWIGTGGTSPFGAYGYHPEGIRIGQEGSNARRAVKVWDKREFRDLDTEGELNNRTMQLALRKLRKFARTGSAEELDLDETIRATSKKGGMLDLQWRPERHNAVKVLLLFDVGGSMDDFIYECQQLFAAARSEFKHLEFYYFHNCVYEEVWASNERRFSEKTPTRELINRYGRDYKLIFVGDATMGPYEIAYPGGSVEHWNEEPGAVWMQRLLAHFTSAVWLNPQPKEHWRWHHSIDMMQELMGARMYPLTLDGISEAIRVLLKKSATAAPVS
ncbi:VWA domain-containing protein [Pseudidiomarina sp. 1APP75-27a]|uniref:vWA domain-containing protein n=1 Tax=Pseudidiomarina terrestris TaxID=2820060 RepID=UPI00265594FB|nr:MULTISPECIES: VWA domain-containing protein [unclassified Pseudidiomarina]MDN7127243.1 VWA domain-containing protein [Pseudidiomarina sp. 1APR75-33.1]MEA3586911.1 VWA domain-containing protein [Pseudidiomarina sp. 1APP75-27a]